MAKKITELPFQIHPRVFSALGEDLVTNDLVAILELIKNSYDAYASKVELKFIDKNDNEEACIQIIDNGCGMDFDIIKDVWCVIGTPNKELSKYASKGRKRRRVSGEKGLGRLSAARLGGSMTLVTKMDNQPIYEVKADWDKLKNNSLFSDCAISIKELSEFGEIKRNGTVIKIQNLRRDWFLESEEEDQNVDDISIDSLKDELARFIPPFKERKDTFEICLTKHGIDTESLVLEPSPVLKEPPYLIRGDVDGDGVLSFRYKFDNLTGEQRSLEGHCNLSDDRVSIVSEKSKVKISDKAVKYCGPFSFEFRVWDFDKDSLLLLNNRFNLDKKITSIREIISKSPYSGISLYRDDILVLPKSATSKDWVGLNLRRVSRVGNRLSANQIVGYIETSNDKNSGLRDTSDRERLVKNDSSDVFKKYIYKIITILEIERDKDRTEKGHTEPPVYNLFSSLKSDDIDKEINELEKGDATLGDAVSLLKKYSKDTKKAADEIEKRFFYYSRLASIGSIAIFLQHEIGNNIGALAIAIDLLKKNSRFFEKIKNANKRIDIADNAIRALTRLADTFAPLGSRTFKTRRRNSSINEIIEFCFLSKDKEITHANIELKLPKKDFMLAMDPGEVTPIFINLLENALYWLSGKGEKIISVSIRPNKPEKGRITVYFSDNGEGVDTGDEERIFWPGVTRKKNGIGMGLTVASELVAQKGGRMYLVKPGELGGATFGFDLPLKE